MEKENYVPPIGNKETIEQLTKTINGLRDGLIHVSDMRIDNSYGRGESMVKRDVHIEYYEMTK
jgi:hypothetical protein